MKPMRALVVVAVALATGGCLNTGQNDPRSSPAEQKMVDQAVGAAEGLLEQSTPAGYRDAPVASGHNSSHDKGQEVSGSVNGRGLLQVACAGTGSVTVTIPRQNLSELVGCGAEPREFPFHKSVTALVVGQRDSAGAYAWRILPAG